MYDYASLPGYHQQLIERLMSLPAEDQRRVLATLLNWAWSDDIGGDIERIFEMMAQE